MKSATGFLVLSLLVPAIVGCLPKRAKTESSQTKAVEVAKPLVSLIGSWVSCDAYPQGAILGIGSSSITYTFRDEATVVMEALYFADDRCKEPFTVAKAESYFHEYEALNKTPAPEDVKQSVVDLARGLREEMPYSATKVAEDETGALDFLSLKNPSYTSYRVSGDSIRIASVCRDLIEEGCEPVGDSPTNRAMDFTEAENLERVRN